MKILWLTSIVPSHSKNGYGGGGWIRSLASKISLSNDVQLFLSYVGEKKESPSFVDGYTLYPIYYPKSIFQKFLYKYFSFYRKKYEEGCIPFVLDYIEQIQPDIVQIFGTESACLPVVEKISVPTFVYIQGLLNPIYNSYYPIKMNDSTFGVYDQFLFKSSICRKIIGGHLNVGRRALREKRIFKKVKYVIGRTNFDYQISRIYAPQSKYFRLNEVMRPSFYVDVPWKKQKRTKYIVFSTLSGATYKGFDVILKSAKLLKEFGVIFEWRIAGINKKNEFVNVFERFVNIRSCDVNVMCLGVLSENQLKNELMECDVFVHPSYIDNSPNSVCEAQLLGVPVIATYVGGIPDFIINEKTGVLVPLNAPFEIAYQIIKDINNPFLYHYSDVARKIAMERHNPGMIVNDLINIYKSILNE